MVAWDWETGKIAWKFEYGALPFESPYTNGRENGWESVYPWHSSSYVADGKLYIFNGEHTATNPATRGWQFWCLNVTTGEPIWHVTMGQGGLGDASRVPQFSIADGYITINDGYTGYLYVIGKGKTATAITAPDVSVAHGTTLMLKGSVLDQSPAQPATPCVSKDSMSLQMDYLHMQMPLGGLWNNETVIGVPVSLDTVDPNGNYVHIADVTTDGYSGTFGYAWTPEIEGDYTVTATFMGDDSYFSSFATTYVNVGPAPEPYPEPVEPEPYPDNSMLLYGILAAVIVAIVLAAVAVFLGLRKR